MDNKRNNINNAVYEYIYKSIINLNLSPGTAMSAAEVAKRMNVSRTPVREAFIMLANIGLVEITPNKNTIVSKINLDMMEEERFMRFCMELGALEIFMDRKKNEHIKKLEENLVKQEEAVAKNDFEAFLRYDNEFHNIFFQVANKENCWKIIQNNSNNYVRIRLLSHKEEPISKVNLDQHKNIFNNIKLNNKEETKKALTEHLSKIVGEKEILKEKYKEYIKTETLEFPENLFDGLS